MVHSTASQDCRKAISTLLAKNFSCSYASQCYSRKIFDRRKILAEYSRNRRSNWFRNFPIVLNLTFQFSDLGSQHLDLPIRRGKSTSCSSTAFTALAVVVLAIAAWIKSIALDTIEAAPVTSSACVWVLLWLVGRIFRWIPVSLWR